MFISLREVPTQWEKCDTELKRLLYIIKNMENMTKKSKPYVIGDYDEFFTASSVGGLSNEEAVAYSNSYYRELDHQSAVRLATQRAEARGLKLGEERGLKLGEERGLKLGEERGLKKGMEQTQRDMVDRMHRNGMTVSQIAVMLGYPEATILTWLAKG